MNKENIPVITDREELYNKCENMEQLFDKYYLPLLDKHYSKTYKLQQENKKQAEEYQKAIDETMSEKMDLENIIDELEKWLTDRQINDSTLDEWTIIEVRNKFAELKGSDSNE